MTLNIQAADKSSAALLAAIHAMSFPTDHVWDAAAIELLMGLPGHFALLAQERDEPVGFLLGRIQAQEAEILTFAVMPRARRIGIGHALLQALITLVAAKGGRDVFLEMAQDNVAAKALYAKAGAQEVGRRRHYYADGSDALVLSITVPERKFSQDDD